MKKIIGIIGSPRKKGNTDLLVSKILSGAGEKGADTKAFHLGELTINGCKSCFFCKKNDGCVTRDDMQGLYAEIKNADALVIGTPIFMWQMTAQTKSFVDRLFAFYLGPSESKIKGKECLLAFTHGSPEGSYKSYIDSTAQMLDFLGLKVKGTITAGNANNGIQDQEELLARAYGMGESLAGD